ncbi:hypothetical protein ACT3OH_16575 [Vreelandella zhanjiangensis]
MWLSIARGDMASKDAAAEWAMRLTFMALMETN